jgi:enoyl-CoA hydratase/carnithine racemase
MTHAFAGNPGFGLAEEVAAFGAAFAHPDQREGMRAFLEKRVPAFSDS